MKRILFAVSAASVMVACNTNPNTTVTTTVTDTTGLAKFQEWRAQQVRDSIALANQAQAAYAPVSSTRSSSGSSSTTRTRSVSSNSNNSGGTTTMTSESSNAASQKKGWSKTAKGAVIGGVAGAGAGAIINKKNRGAGAVIGGVVGAGAGAIIGHEKDKKDGRH